jgi:hypothetical protein
LKTIASITLLFILSATLLVQCKKHADDSVYQSSFYKTQDKGKLFLYVNGAKQGELPYFPTEPKCGERNSEGVTPIMLTLPSGEYRIEGRDSLGLLITCSVMFISKSYSSLSSGQCGGGGATMFNSGDCLIYGLIEK